jgi:transposase-like protein
MEIGASEAATFWIEFLRKLTRRGLRGVKLVISSQARAAKLTQSIQQRWVLQRV